MQSPRRPLHAWPASLSLALCTAALAGCASPGSPRAPSLHLPEPARDLTAVRSGDTVQIRFTTPSRTTDSQPIRDHSIAATLCRQDEPNARCLPVDLAQTRDPLPVPGPEHKAAASVLWTDPLPASLVTGPARLLSYRVELRNSAGRSAGPSSPAYALAGTAPPPIAAFTAQGTRLGILLHWTPVTGAGEVLLERTQLPASTPATPAPSRPAKQAATLWLQAQPGNDDSAGTLDHNVAENTPYRYVAIRRSTVHIGGRTLDLRSAPSQPVTMVWRDIYPPPVPQGLTALGFTVPASPTSQPAYAVDLVWQPVGDPRLAGYIVYRQALDTAGTSTGTRQRLTATPIPTPGFHDATASAGQPYRYQVTAIDLKGNESAAASADVQPASP